MSPLAVDHVGHGQPGRAAVDQAVDDDALGHHGVEAHQPAARGEGLVLVGPGQGAAGSAQAAAARAEVEAGGAPVDVDGAGAAVGAGRVSHTRTPGAEATTT